MGNTLERDAPPRHGHRSVTTEIEAQGGAPWFVIWTHPRAEKKVEKRIGALGLDVWLPTVTERHRWSDRWKEVSLPLFPGYLFVRARAVEWQTVLSTRGILTVVKHAGAPALLSADFIAGLRRGIDSESLPVETVDAAEFEKGDEVVVQEGVLQGVKGVVREKRNRRQLVIWVEEIGRGVALTIGSALVTSIQRV